MVTVSSVEDISTLRSVFADAITEPVIFSKVIFKALKSVAELSPVPVNVLEITASIDPTQNPKPPTSAVLPNTLE